MAEIYFVNSRTGRVTSVMGAVMMHGRYCPICQAAFLAEDETRVENNLAQHIARSHVNQWSNLEVHWTLEDLKILEGMKISPK